MAEARAVITEVRPTFSMTFWKADGEWRVILHRACGDSGSDLSVTPRASARPVPHRRGAYLAPSSLLLALESGIFNTLKNKTIIQLLM